MNCQSVRSSSGLRSLSVGGPKAGLIVVRGSDGSRRGICRMVRMAMREMMSARIEGMSSREVEKNLSIRIIA